MGIIVVVGVVNAWLILPVFFLAIIFYKLRQIYLTTARAVKRLESTSISLNHIYNYLYYPFSTQSILARSPVFTHLSSSLVGLTTLRAHQSQKIFQNVFDDCQDIHSSAWYMFLSTTRWFGIYLDWICVVYVACVTYTCTALRGSKLNSKKYFYSQ